jgi:hypothetical protein
VKIELIPMRWNSWEHSINGALLSQGSICSPRLAGLVGLYRTRVLTTPSVLNGSFVKNYFPLSATWHLGRSEAPPSSSSRVFVHRVFGEERGGKGVGKGGDGGHVHGVIILAFSLRMLAILGPGYRWWGC